MPWCVRKCPYCDFVHAVSDGELSVDLEQQYLEALVADFGLKLKWRKVGQFIAYLLVVERRL